MGGGPGKKHRVAQRTGKFWGPGGGCPVELCFGAGEFNENITRAQLAQLVRKKEERAGGRCKPKLVL